MLIGRALTPEQKRECIERLMSAWLKYPEMRLGQLITNKMYNGDHKDTPLFYIEDYALINDLEKEFGAE